MILAASEPDIPWAYVAMIVIYFIAWLLKKIKGSTSGEEENESPEKGRTLAQVQENRKRHLQRQAAREEAPTDGAEALRKLFESIGGETPSETESFLPEAEPPPLETAPSHKSATPPPLSPSSGFDKTKPKAPKLSATEKKALADLKGRQNAPTSIRRKHRPRSLRSMTRGQGLQQAVVLKEILDHPRSLRPY